MKAQALLEEFRRGGPFQLALLRYTQALITQISQIAVCNRLHTVEKRLCRWLLLTRDRVPSDELLMTQEFIAHMLGVRREGVTAAAHQLHRAGLIRYATSPSLTVKGWRPWRANATASSRPNLTDCFGQEQHHSPEFASS
jgi:CRP-like cAMP-binding protein